MAILSQAYTSGHVPSGAPGQTLVLRDHLGSVDVLLAWHADGSVAVAAELSFDAWGQRRYASDWFTLTPAEVYSLAPAHNALTTRGFTNHEMVDEVGIIHMNGRIYDPRLGRFLQADPFIQDASFTQSYNRYSYGFNNPLNGTDPSGFSFWRDLIGFLTNGIAELFADKIPFLRPLLQIAHCVLGGPVVCGFSAFGNTIAAGGSVKDALINGVSAYAFSSIPGPGNFGFNPETVAYVAEVAALGGVVAELQGGKFGHGFVSSGLSAVAGGAIGGNPTIARTLGKEGRFIASIVVGGTLSELTGGKFVNGAITAAFAYAASSLSRLGDEGDSFSDVDDDVKMSNWIRSRVKINGEGQMELNLTADYVSGLERAQVDAWISDMELSWNTSVDVLFHEAEY